MINRKDVLESIATTFNNRYDPPETEDPWDWAKRAGGAHTKSSPVTSPPSGEPSQELLCRVSYVPPQVLVQPGPDRSQGSAGSLRELTPQIRIRRLRLFAKVVDSEYIREHQAQATHSCTGSPLPTEESDSASDDGEHSDASRFFERDEKAGFGVGLLLYAMASTSGTYHLSFVIAAKGRTSRQPQVNSGSWLMRVFPNFLCCLPAENLEQPGQTKDPQLTDPDSDSATDDGDSAVDRYIYERGLVAVCDDKPHHLVVFGNTLRHVTTSATKEAPEIADKVQNDFLSSVALLATVQYYTPAALEAATTSDKPAQMDKSEPHARERDVSRDASQMSSTQYTDVPALKVKAVIGSRQRDTSYENGATAFPSPRFLENTPFRCTEAFVFRDATSALQFIPRKAGHYVFTLRPIQKESATPEAARKTLRETPHMISSSSFAPSSTRLRFLFSPTFPVLPHSVCVIDQKRVPWTSPGPHYRARDRADNLQTPSSAHGIQGDENMTRDVEKLVQGELEAQGTRPSESKGLDLTETAPVATPLVGSSPRSAPKTPTDRKHSGLDVLGEARFHLTTGVHRVVCVP